MTQTPSNPPTNPPAPGPAPGAAPAPAAPRVSWVRRWFRRFSLAVVLLLVLAIALRVSLAWLMPSVLRKVAGAYQFDCSYDRLQLSLLGGDVDIWGLKLTPLRPLPTSATSPATGPASRPAAAPAIQAEYLRAYISPFELLKGRIHAWRLEADAAEILVDREPDGRIPLLDRILAQRTAAPTPAPGGAASTDLVPPLKVEALRVQRLRAHFRDRSVFPEVNSHVVLDLRLSDVGEPSRPIRYDVEVSAEPLLEGLRLEGEARIQGRTIDATSKLSVRSLRVKAASAYLSMLGLRSLSNEVAVRLESKISLTLAPPPATTLTGSLQVDQLWLAADGREAFAIDHLELGPVKLGPGAADLSKLTVEGARLHASRTSDGRFHVAGFEMTPEDGSDLAELPDALAPAATRAATSPASAPAATAKSVAKQSAVKQSVAKQSASKPAAATQPAFQVGLREFTLRKARADFRDEAVTPAAELALEVDELTASTPSATLTGNDLALEVKGALRSPRLARSVQVHGSARPLSTPMSASLKLTAEGVKLDAVRPYLDLVNLESDLHDARLACDINAAVTLGPKGRIGGELHMSGLELRDRDEAMLAVDELHVSNVMLDPQVGHIDVEDIQLVGPAIVARREASGGFAAFGFHTKPFEARARPAPPRTRPDDAEAETAPADETPAVPIPIPRVRIGHFGWHQFRLKLADETVTPASNLVITDAGIDLSDILIDLDSPEPDPRPGKIYVWFFAPGLAESLRIDGEFNARRHAMTATLQVEGKGLNATPLAPYVEGMGFEPTLRHGSLRVNATASLARKDGGLDAALSLQDLRYADGATNLASAESVRVNGLRLRAGQFELDELNLVKSHGQVVREADGGLLLAGVRLPPRPPAPATTQPATEPAGPPLAFPFVAMLKHLHVDESSLTWIDQVPRPAVSTILGASVNLSGLVLGRSAEPATIDLTASAAGAVEKLTLKGTISPDPEGPRAKLDVAATGLRAGSLAPYVPAGVNVSLRDGRFKTGLDAQWVRHEEGGQRGHVHLTGLELRDGAEGPQLLAFSSAKVQVNRFDAVERVIALGDVTLENAQTRARRAADGSLELPGLTIPPAPPGAPRRGYELPTVYPLITIENLNLHLATLALADASLPHSPQVRLDDLRLRSLAPVECLGPQASLRPPIELELTGKEKDLVDSIKLTTKLSPFGNSARADVAFRLAGLHGPSLLHFAPAAKEYVDADEVQRAVVEGRITGSVRLDRRSPLDFDLSRGFEFGMTLRDTTFREGPEEEVLLGVDELRIEGGRVEPKFAGVEIRGIEITRPVGHFVRDTDGIRAVGCVFKVPGLTGPPTTQPAVAASRPATPGSPGSPAATSPSGEADAAAIERPAREVKVNKLAISGIDVMLEDWAVEPALFIPLNALEFEAHDLSSLALQEPKPMRFSLVLNAGKVSLPREALPPVPGMPAAGLPASAALPGPALATATSPATAPATSPATAPARVHLPPTAMESREPFAQIASSGRLTLYPSPAGWMKASINSLELQALRGSAKANGVTIYGGMFDASADLRLSGDGAARVLARLVFTDLRVYEPPNGPIFKLFHLPAPLDVGIGALQDPDGSITLPLDLSFSPGDTWAEEIVGAVIGQVPGIVATAIASAPLKALGVKGERDTKPEPPTTIAFVPGSTVLDSGTAQKIEALAARLRKEPTLDLTVRHILGPGDVAMAKVRANPSKADAVSLVAQLREKKANLGRLREEVAGRARGQLASRFEAETAEATLARLRAIDAELAQTEDSLDRVSALLRPGAERQADRRSRAASLEIARQRIEAVRAALLAHGVPDFDRRVQFFDPGFTVAPAAPGSAPGGQVILSVVKGAAK